MSPQRDRRAGQAVRRGRAGRRLQRLGGPPRFALIGFAVLFAGLFAGFGIAQGIGHPSVPSDAIIVVEDLPNDETTVTDCHGNKVTEDPGTITRAEFDCALKQTAAQGGLKKLPKPGSSTYESLKSAAISTLLDIAWIQGEAADDGVTVTKRQSDAQLASIASRNFGCKAGQDPFACKGLQQFLKTSRFSEDDVLLRVKLQLLSSELQRRITAGAAKPTEGDIKDYYTASQDQYTTPATRDVRLVLNRDKSKVDEAKARLEKDDSVASWKTIAKEFSTDISSRKNGGLRSGLTEGLLEEPLNSAVFAASVGQLEGPIKTPLGYYVFEVEKTSPETTQPLSKVQTQIRTQLTQTAQNDAFREFVSDYGSKWQARTFCAPGYVIERCANFKGSGHPATAPPGCYEAHPKGGRPDACPAPVLALTPALPGTVSIVTPQGQRLPQRPRPAGLKAAPPASLPGAAVPTAPTP